jgi:hypothetical protein
MSIAQRQDCVLLYAGILAGLLFFIIPTIEIFRRPAFDITRHAISMLSLGEGGWIMKTVFVICGLLTLAAAAGIFIRTSSALSGSLAALLIAGYGIGLILAGFFDAPEGLGFPPGTPADQQPVMTRDAQIHSLAFMIAFGSLIISCFVFAVFFIKSGAPLWGATSIAVGLALPVMIASGISMVVAPGVAFYFAAMLGWLWLGLVLNRLC